MTPREVYSALRAYSQERDRRTNISLDVMRTGIFAWFNLSVPRDKRVSDPRQILKFKHDDELPENTSEIYIPTPDEWEEMDRRLAGKIDPQDPQDPGETADINISKNVDM